MKNKNFIVNGKIRLLINEIKYLLQMRKKKPNNFVRVK